MYLGENTYYATVLLSYMHVCLFKASVGFYIFQLTYLTFHEPEDP
jgi:hypothetical protein